MCMVLLLLLLLEEIPRSPLRGLGDFAEESHVAAVLHLGWVCQRPPMPCVMLDRATSAVCFQWLCLQEIVSPVLLCLGCVLKCPGQDACCTTIPALLWENRVLLGIELLGYWSSGADSTQEL